MGEGAVDGAAEDGLVAGRYRLQEPLGQGGSGTARRAFDEVLGRDVALEQHPPDAAGRVRGAIAVRHPHLVPILDVVEEAEKLWVVRERVSARSLAEIVGEHGPMPAAAATLIGAQVASALADAHAAGVTHG